MSNRVLRLVDMATKSWWLVVLVIALFGCARDTRWPDLSEREGRLVFGWMECDECTSGQADSVVALGQDVVNTLRTLLLEGPAPQDVVRYRRHLQDVHRRLQLYAATHPGTQAPRSSHVYVGRYLNNYIATYQVRAALALARIGGPQARQALDSAATRPWRSDVAEAIHAALDSL